MSSYVPVRVSTLRSKYVYDFDIFVKVSEKYIMYFKNGDTIEDDRLDSLKKKSVKQLFITGESEVLYQNFLDKWLNDVIENPTASINEKVDTLVSSAGDRVDNTFKNPESKASYEGAKSAARGVVNMVNKNQEILKGLFNKGRGDDFLIQNAINVSALVSKFGEIMNLSKPEIETLSLAGLLHNIGAAKMEEHERTIFSKPYSKLSAEELVRYKQHPILGAELLQGKPYASSEVVNLILKHEERNSGKGFPFAVNNLTISEQILAICAEYDRRVTCVGDKTDDALQEMMRDELGNFELELMNKFRKFTKDEKLGA